MHTATLKSENLSTFCPVTNLYECSDGRYLLVTFPHIDVLGSMENMGIADALNELGMQAAPMALSHIHPIPTTVVLADEAGVAVDADGDPQNGLTALAEYPPGTTVQDALAALGYTLTEQETTS
ncbi:hypothetical protein JTZ10_21795 [Gordonia rubripertincta]|uniref:DUF7572 domain-containing protein n=1 Tax=Gordonia rubripertincta TaxID=36822 RepID=A0AAW4G9E0_GORRU|nr:hypothetical protein [Gordonia rubripertincta]MBM7280382.1 hypothetical protein [Gordonia rubripertincta]